MEFRNEQPIYLQIAQKIKEQIVNGSLGPDEKLPSVRECSVLYEVSALTIQRAIQYLESEGVISSRKGVGNFVRKESLELLRHQMVRMQVQEFVQTMRNCGCGPDEILAMVREELSGQSE